jgi:hypothetical protein
MDHQEGFDNIFQTLYIKLQPSYSIISVGDLSKTMLNIGIPEEEVSTITYIFDKLGTTHRLGLRPEDEAPAGQLK